MKIDKTELKVKASALTALAISLAGTWFLAGTATDFVSSLPDQLEVPAYSLIASGLVWLAGWRTRNVAGKLAPSTISAVQEQINNARTRSSLD